MGNPTPREALLRRRDEYLARVSLHDDVTLPEQFDGRPAEVRRFRRGGDDVPPDCMPSGEERRRRHRVPRHGDDSPERAAADERIRKERSDNSDYDQFATGP